MIKQTPQDCMGAQPLWRKLWIALSILTSPLTLLLDKLGLVEKPLYQTRTGMKLYTRGKTTDINDVVVVMSGNEYPKDLLGLSGDRPNVLDVGGHIGSFTLYLKSHYPNSQIWAMEPVKANQELFQKNISLNNLSNITLIPYALYGASGTYYIDLSGKQFDALEVSPEKPAHNDYVTIDALSLPDVINRYYLPRIDLMKMDIEGSEYHVFQHSLEVLSSHVKRLIMEFHPAGDKAKRDEIVNRLCNDGPFELIYETKNILGFNNKNLNG